MPQRTDRRAPRRPAWAMLAALGLSACGLPYTPPALSPADIPAPAAATPTARQPVTILVSIDGFRADYLARGVTPNLRSLAATGVSAAMRPSFPSITFPNHWTLVTGVRPDRSGIVGNTMEDPRRPGETFTMATDDPFWWDGAEPIWVTAEKAGVRTGTVFWPGASVGWGGTRDRGAVTGGTWPSDWMAYAGAITDRQRVDTVIDWLRRPDVAERPRFVSLYFDVIDHVGHEAGPDAPRLTAALATLDVQIGRLRDRLAALEQPANLVIVADHGMAATSPDRVIALDRILAPADYRLVTGGAYAGIEPMPGREATVAAALATPTPHLRCWPRERIPARFAYGRNPRVPRLVCLADVGWVIVDRVPDKPRPAGGTHGYDNDAPTMRALFIANGPAFRHPARLATFDNVDVAPLIRDLLGLPAGTGLDGDDAPFRGVLTR